jgi:IS30 family transposase
MSSNRIKLKDLKYVENLLNNRPRKRLNYLTPKEVFLKN